MRCSPRPFFSHSLVVDACAWKEFFFVFCFRERGFEVIFPLLFSFSLSLKRKKRQSNQIESKSPHHDVAADGLDRGPGEHRPAVEVGGDDLEFFFFF